MNGINLVFDFEIPEAGIFLRLNFSVPEALAARHVSD